MRKKLLHDKVFAFRLLQTCSLFMTGLFGGLVFLGNLMDYDSNFAFVKHVLSMDTVFESNATKWKAITNPFVHHLVYWVLILAEGIFAAVAMLGVLKMFQNLKASGKAFASSKVFAYYAVFLALCIWFFGFVIVGSEWFGMWQSESWNGKETAMNISLVMLATGILLSLDPGEMEHA